MKLVNVATAPGSSHAHTPTMVVGCLKPCAPTALQSRCAGFGGRPCRRVKRRRVCAPGATEEEEGAGALAELQRKLEVGRGAQERSEEKRMEYEAVQLAETLQQSGEARNFGRGEQVATASARQEVLRLNGIEKRRLVERKGREAPRLPQLAGSLLLSSLFLVAGTAGEADAEELILLAAGFAGLWLVDQAALGGTGQLVLTDALARASPSLRERVAYHEAGHFLVGYLMGRLPKAYALGSLDALRNGALPAQGGTAFCDAALEDEVARGRVASNTVREVGAIALAGVCAEYVRFGDAEGGKDDIATLDGLYRSLGFSQRSTDFEVTFFWCMGLGVCVA